MAKRSTLHCSVITPERQVVSADVESVIMPAHDGLIGVLRDRAPLLCELSVGVLTLSGSAGRSEYFVDGGFAQVLENEVTVLTPRALAPQEINRESARKALEDAHQLKITDDASFVARTNALARAQAQLKLTA